MSGNCCPPEPVQFREIRNRLLLPGHRDIQEQPQLNSGLQNLILFPTGQLLPCILQNIINCVSQSNDTTICAGEPITLKVVSEGYNLNYSWFKDDTFIKSGDSPELSFNTATKDSTGIYRCDITGSCGEVLSPEINLTVLPVTVINHITPDTEAAFGDDITLEVIADGHNLLYQWQKDEPGDSGRYRSAVFSC